MDGSITQWINSAAGASHMLDMTMIGITRFGVPVMVALVVVQWWSRRGRTHVRHAAVVAGLSFLVGLGLNQIVLLFMQRVRPYDAGLTHLIVAPSADWSFPSDHATAAFAIVAAFALQALPGRAAVFAAMAMLIGWSRIFVGTHYVTDILGGAVTAVVAAILVGALYREGTRFDRFVTAII